MILVRDLLSVRLNARVLRGLALVIGLSFPLGAPAFAQSDAKPATTDTKPATTETKPADKPVETKPAPATPDTKAPPSSTPTTAAPAPAPANPGTKTPDATPAPTTPAPTIPAPDAKTPAPTPDGKSHDTEIEPNGSPGIPQNAQTESVDVPKRPVVMVPGRSSYDDAFKSIKASLDTVKKAMDKAGLKPAGHPITIFSEPDDKGFKYKAAIPIAKPDGKPDLGADVTIGESPAGKAIKFQHRGAYEDIDSTYDVITAYLDAKGLQVDNPYIEEYLTDLSTPDDPNLQVDIYVFVKP